MKKFILSIVSLLLLFSMVSLSCFAEERDDTAYNWYVKRAGNNRPMVEPEQAFISSYGGYYIDEKVSDDSKDKVIYLTFDAGYENGNVTKILDVLKKENVPAAFFILDYMVTRYPELCRRMINEGHLVCNHTKNHQDMTKLTKEEIKNNLKTLENHYFETFGVPMAKYFRFPEGRYSKEALSTVQELGYRSIFWSFGYADWNNDKQPNAEKAKKLILDNTHNGEVILLHPTSKTNAEIIEDLICEWRGMGYRFGSLDELTK